MTRYREMFCDLGGGPHMVMMRVREHDGFHGRSRAFGRLPDGVGSPAGVDDNLFARRGVEDHITVLVPRLARRDQRDLKTGLLELSSIPQT